MTCGICRRTLDQPGDSDSVDCGGDCWGCVKEAENNAGVPMTIEEEVVNRESAWSIIHEMDRDKVRCDECGKRGFVRDPRGTCYCGPCAEIKGFWERT